MRPLHSLLAALLVASPTFAMPTWVINPSPTTNVLNAIAHGPGGVVAVGNGGAILNSADGKTWTASPSTTGLSLYAIVASDTRWIIAGDSGVILSSVDGAHWNTVDVPRAFPWKAAAFSPTRGFVLIADRIQAAISATGETWTVVTDPAFTASVEGIGVTEGVPGQFVRIVSGNVGTSSDGLNWMDIGNFYDQTALGNFGDYLFLVGRASSSKAQIWVGSKTDLTPPSHWSLFNTPSPFSLNAFAATDDRYVIVGNSGATLTSTNRSSWEYRQIPGDPDWRGLAYWNNHFIAVGARGKIGSLYFGAPIEVSVPPQSQVHFTNEMATFRVQANSSLPIAYQWFKDAAPISNATNDTLSLGPLTESDSAKFKVRLQTSGETLFADEVSLTVISRLAVNLFSPTPNGIFSSAVPIHFAATADSSDPIADLTFIANDTVISAATASPFEIDAPLQPGQYALRSVVHTIHGAAATSAPVSIRVEAPLPGIVDAPYNQHVWIGASNHFDVWASGFPPLQYQWFKDGSPIQGAQNSQLNLTITNLAQAGEYRVRVGNANGAVESSATLLVDATPPDVLSRLWVTNGGFFSVAFTGLALGNGSLVAVGDLGFITVSRDGKNWRHVPISNFNHLKNVRFLNGEFWAIGLQGTILTSYDGSSWTDRSFGTTDRFIDITYGNGVYLLACESDAAGYISSDGIHWQPNLSLKYATLTFGNGVFVKNYYGTASVSSDGIIESCIIR